MELKEIRREIDQIDQQMLELFCRRMELSSQISAYKKERGLPIFVPEREQQILFSLREQAGPQMSGYICDLYHKVFELSRRYQSEVIK